MDISEVYGGSSPRVRGSPSLSHSPPHPVGIIPAGAGLTPCSGRCWTGRWDHPRGCGAHFCHAGANAGGKGSSPRVRGSRLALAAALDHRGIIPAGAGLTNFSPTRSRGPWDHPRGCGAHLGIVSGLLGFEGSSPRVRGSHQCYRYKKHGDGIIPAGAGLTKGLRAVFRKFRDHPRGCGAHYGERGYRKSGAGSSPRVRGSHRIVLNCDSHLGIIPAGAGLT